MIFNRVDFNQNAAKYNTSFCAVKPPRTKFIVSGVLFNMDPFEVVSAKKLGKAYNLFQRAEIIFFKACNHFDNAKNHQGLTLRHELKKSQIRINSTNHFIVSLKEYLAKDKRPLTRILRRFLKNFEREIGIRQRAIIRLKRQLGVGYAEEKLFTSRPYIR